MDVLVQIGCDLNFIEADTEPEKPKIYPNLSYAPVDEERGSKKWEMSKVQRESQGRIIGKIMHT